MLKRLKSIVRLTTFLSLLFPPFIIFSQTIGEWANAERKIPDQKIYLHCDREFYFRRETIWFRVYILDSKTLHPALGYENLFVDLINDKGKVLLNCNLIASEGTASGYFFLNDSIITGNYIIRAYTDYLKHFGEETYFYKKVRISEIMNSLELKEAGLKPGSKKQLPDLSFLPEGGFLLAGFSNLVAVKAVDTSGKGIKVKGIIRTQDNDSVTVFETGYKGMASFYFLPEYNSNYHVELSGFPEYRFDFKDIRKEGIKLQLILQNEKEVVVNALSNSGKFNGNDFYLVNMYRGKAEFYKQFQIKNNNRLFRLDKNMFPGGINRIVLLNDELQPVSERLVFSENYDLNALGVKSDSGAYPTRSKINVQVVDQEGLSPDEISSLSVAVVNDNAVNAEGVSQNILSWMLLGSELKGYIESPADCFITDSIASAQKLDLVMLTHGWSNYLQNSLEKGKDSSVYCHTSGINLMGRVERLIGVKPVENGEISMLVFRKNDIEFLGGITDSRGLFDFGNIFFYDSASVFIQARTNKGRKYTEVFLDPVFEDRPDISRPPLDELRCFSAIPTELYRRKYLNDIALREFFPDSGSILLGEVEVKKFRKEKDDGHFRMYGSADNSIKISDRDVSYSDVLSFLAGRVAGLMISGNIVSIRGGGSPLYLIDGIPFEGEDGYNMIRSIPMSDIDVVEVLKDISNLALFGSRGANGVIAVYTKRGVSGSSNDYLMGVLTRRIMGYQSFKEFYSPKYTCENADSPAPDYRTTLYWNPQVLTRNSKADLSFFSCDEVADYTIFVEGITTNGRICLGTGRFSVDRFRDLKQIH